VEDDQYVLALVHPVLADGRAGVGREPLEAGRVGRRRGHDRGVLQGTGLLQRRAHAGDRGALLPYGDVDAADLLGRVAAFPVRPLVDDRVDAHRGLAGLAVTDDQLALAAADRGHRVDRLDAGLQRLGDVLALYHARRLQLQRPLLLGGDLADAVGRRAERVNAADQVSGANRHRKHAAGALDRLALLDALEVAEDDRADVANVEVERDAKHAALELEQLVGHGRGQALDVRDAVTRVDHDTDLFGRGIARERGDVIIDRAPDLVRWDRQCRHGSGVPALVVSVAGVSVAEDRSVRQALARGQHPPGQAAVDPLVADPDDEAADQLGAQLHLQSNRPAVEARQ